MFFTFFDFLIFGTFFQFKRTRKSQVLLACFDIVFSYHYISYNVLCITIYYYSEKAVNDKDRLHTHAPE